MMSSMEGTGEQMRIPTDQLYIVIRVIDIIIIIANHNDYYSGVHCA